MAKFRKKPVVIEAEQWLGGSTGANGFGAIKYFCPTAEHWLYRKLLPNGENVHDPIDGEPMLRIPTLEGQHWALTNDWIIKGVRGEFYPIKPDIFAATYEPVAE